MARLCHRNAAEAARLDSLRSARYGLGDSDAALAREQLQLATRLAEHRDLDWRMLLAIVFALGAFVGWQRAARRDGDRLDRLQYAAAHGIAFALAALAIWIVAARLRS